MYVVKNKDIDHKITNYLVIFDKEGSICFQLLPIEYKGLTKLTKWYKNKREHEIFDEKSWGKDLLELNLTQESTATFVFLFLVKNWNKNTHISVEKAGEFVLVVVEKIVRH